MIRHSFFRFSLQLILGTWLLCLPALSLAETPRVTVTPSPAWVTPDSSDFAHDSLVAISPDESSSGLTFLLLDRQIDVASQAITSHIAYRITSQNGLSAGAQISAGFDPAYETLSYHFIRLWRDGKAQNRLVLDDFKILQQERDSDRQIYNGELSAILLLKDVRVGDIVEYSRTARGANPVFGGKFLATEYAGWASPVRHQLLRVIVPPGRTLAWREQGEFSLLLKKSDRGDGSTELCWEGHHLAPIDGDTATPAWFIQYPYLELSEFASWPDVVRWALPLYDFKSTASPATRKKAHALTQGLKTTQARALALLDFVQREIRYLGIELGPNSHQPHAPDEVLEQRFGDCKDKVFLLCTLLQELGIPARPVLVNTHLMHDLSRHLPSPYAFNHVIAAIAVDGRTYIVDPTRNYQRGDLATRDQSENSVGLAIAEDTSAKNPLLTLTAQPVAAGLIDVRQVYTVSGYQQPVALRQDYYFSGNSAENVRYYLANNSREAISRDYLDGLKRGHPDVAFSAPPKWTDDEATNLIHINLTASVKGLWKPAAGGDTYIAEFYPWSLHSYVLQPDSLTRKAPLGLSHPVDVQVTTQVKFQDDWALSDSSNIIETPWYKFTTWTRYKDRTFEMYYQWKSLSDYVPANEISTHIAKLEEIREHTGYTLSRNLKLDKLLQEFAPNWISIVITMAVIGGWIWFGIWLNRRPPSHTPPLIVNSKLQGIGGWLALVAFGVIVRPLTLIASLAPQWASYYDQRIWLRFMSSDFPTYQPSMGFVLMFELVGNLSVISLSLVTAVLFFRQRKELPRMMIVMLASIPTLGFVDLILVSIFSIADNPSPESASALGQSSFYALIWIPYFLISRRVKATFVR